jgi:hypothetical protein
MKASRAIRLATLGLALAVAFGCDHQSSVPVAATEALSAPDEARLPFDREAQKDGISPTSSVIPPGAQLPAGTPITIRLQNALSSRTATSDDKFEAVLDEPIIMNRQVLAERGAAVTGRVIEARAVAQMQSPGYLRLALVSIFLNGKSAVLRTSSTFLKGPGPGPGRRHATVPMGSEPSLMGAAANGKGPLLGNALAADSMPAGSLITRPRDVTVGPERRLTFRLVEPLPLNP